MRRFSSPQFRPFIRGLALGFGAALLLALFVSKDWTRVIDSFFEAQVQRKSMAVWSRRAADVGYQDCLSRPDSCLNKIVVWPVSHTLKGRTYYDQSAGFKIRWRNEEQVPLSYRASGPFKAVGIVTRVAAGSVELIYIGTPETFYSGTTWASKFGFDRNERRGETVEEYLKSIEGTTGHSSGKGKIAGRRDVPADLAEAWKGSMLPIKTTPDDDNPL